MDLKWIKEKFDTNYAEKIMQELASITDYPELGGRGSGSPAEHRAAEFLTNKFKEVGLKNVNKDACPVDKWVLRKSELTYQTEDGKSKRILLGGHACNVQCNHDTVSLIYAGKGTAEDYRSIDPQGKLVLIEINQVEDWWINFPAYEAKHRGALGVICMNTGGFGQEGDNVLVSEDICGPSDLFAFSIGQQDGEILKELILNNSKHAIQVVLNIDSIVEENGITYNVWGDIPGKTDEVIYIINHYDSYYHTVFDDVQGIGWALGLANAILKNGYQPNKTIRIIAHGAEEWGLIDSKYDWAIGAYRQITQIHPEWAENGFAVINLDGFYAVEGEKKFCIVCTKELYDFVNKTVEEYGDTKGYKIEVNMDLTSSTEDFSYTRAGIPSLVAGAYDGCLADRKVLHSSESSWNAGFDHHAFALFHSLFAHILIALDQQMICPINFVRRLEDVRAGLDIAGYSEEVEVIGDILESAVSLNQYITKFNSKALKNPDKSYKGSINGDCGGKANRKIHETYRFMHSQLIRLDWNDQMILPHQRYISNLQFLSDAQELILAGKYECAIDMIAQVDFNYYAVYFSMDTYRYFEKQVTERSKDSWGSNLIENGNEDLSELILLLRNESSEIKGENLLQQACNRQQGYLDEAIKMEIETVYKMKLYIDEINAYFQS